MGRNEAPVLGDAGDDRDELAGRLVLGDRERLPLELPRRRHVLRQREDALVDLDDVVAVQHVAADEQPGLLELLPLTVRDAVLDLGGAQTAMASFRGRGRADWQRMAGGAAAAGLD